MADWSAKMAKIEEASRKKDDLANEFITHTKEILDDKMQKYENKRESHISEIKEKLKVSTYFKMQIKVLKELRITIKFFHPRYQKRISVRSWKNRRMRNVFWL